MESSRSFAAKGAMTDAAMSPALFPRAVHLSEEIASYIRELIMSGQLKAGRALNIDRIAKELQTSTTPVREALHALRGEGFVQFEPRRGFRIAPLSRSDVEDLFLVQGQLAGELARRAAKRIPGPNLERVRQVQLQMAEASDHRDMEEIERLNFEFHRIINGSAASPKLAWLLSVVVRYVPRRFYSMIPGWPEASVRDHNSIIEALIKHDPDKARTAMTAHIEHAGQLLVTHLENQGFWAEEPPAEEG